MDKHNKNEKTIVLRPYVDYRGHKQFEPEQREIPFWVRHFLSDYWSNHEPR